MSGSATDPFSIIWSNSLFLANIYNFVTVFFFLGINGFPEGNWLGFEVGTEIFFIIEVFFRYLL
jgi:hypothetical protein